MNSQHPNIIRFFGVYENVEKNHVGLVMELCSNGNVANYVVKHSLNWEQKLRLMKGIANGMQYLHHHNIAHRDLKCENVLLDSSLTPKIIDFGYSKELNDKANRSMNLTMNIGTAAYCAPEVIKSQFLLEQQSQMSHRTAGLSTATSFSQVAYDKKCDVYSFAIIMYVI